MLLVRCIAEACIVKACSGAGMGSGSSFRADALPCHQGIHRVPQCYRSWRGEWLTSQSVTWCLLVIPCQTAACSGLLSLSLEIFERIRDYHGECSPFTFCTVSSCNAVLSFSMTDASGGMEVPIAFCNAPLSC